MVRLSVQRLRVNIPTIEEDGVQSHVDGTGNVRVVVIAYHNGRLELGTCLGKSIVEELFAGLVGPGILTENDGREIALQSCRPQLAGLHLMEAVAADMQPVTFIPEIIQDLLRSRYGTWLTGNDVAIAVAGA